MAMRPETQYLRGETALHQERAERSRETDHSAHEKNRDSSGKTCVEERSREQRHYDERHEEGGDRAQGDRRIGVLRPPCEQLKAGERRFTERPAGLSLLFQISRPVDDAGEAAREDAQRHAHSREKKDGGYRGLNEVNDIHTRFIIMNLRE